MTATAWKPVTPDTPRDRRLIVKIGTSVQIAEWSDRYNCFVYVLPSRLDIVLEAGFNQWAEIPE